MEVRLMEKTKEQILRFIMERYNPDKTFIEVELAEIWKFFDITEEDILKDTQEALKNGL